MPPRLDTLFRATDSNFTQEETQNVFKFSKEILGNNSRDTLYAWLLLLLKQGQITENNVVLLEKYLATQSSNKEEIEKEVEIYKKELQKARPVITGRDEEIERITTKLQTDENAILNLHGASGVGKTTLAKEICHRWDEKLKEGRSLDVDLREVKEMKLVYFHILQALEPLKTIPTYEQEAVLKRVRQLKKEDKLVLVLLDNSEQFAGGKDKESKNLRTAFLGFLKRLKSPEVDKFKKLRILLTSRNQFNAADKLVEDVPVKPLEKEKSGKLLKSMGEPAIDAEQKTRMLEICGGRPLFLNTMAAALRQEQVKPEELFLKIEEETSRATGEPMKTVTPSGAEKPESGKVKPEESRPTEEAEIDAQDLPFLNQMFLNLPSKGLKDAAVSLSLFCHPFLLETSAKVLQVGVNEAAFLLESLRSYGIISIVDPDAKELLYDIHPLLKTFVNGIQRKPDFTQVYQEAETQFSRLFMKKATRLAKLLDEDYVAVHQRFNAERANFELAIDITTKRDYLFIHDKWTYHKNAMMCFLFDAMLNSETRMALFKSWAETAEKEGKGMKNCVHVQCHLQAHKNFTKFFQIAVEFLTTVEVYWGSDEKEKLDDSFVQLERERETETETETERERQRERERERDRQTDRQKDRETERERQRERQRCFQGASLDAETVTRVHKI